MKKSIIFVEGPADAVFLNDLIFHLMPEGSKRYKEISKFKIGKAIQIYKEPIIELFVSGGCTHIQKFNKKISEFYDEGYNIILIQDADNPEKDSYLGGFQKRMEYLDQMKTKYSIDFYTFLLPNHKNDGDLEEILEKLVLKGKYDLFYNNYLKYCLEIEKFSSSFCSNELLQLKYRIYGYCQVFHGMELANERNRDYHNKHWNLDHSCLDSLKAFLVLQLSI